MKLKLLTAVLLISLYACKKNNNITTTPPVPPIKHVDTAQLKTARAYAAAAAVGDKIYIFGGSNGNLLNTIEVFDTKTNTSNILPGVTLSQAKNYLTATAVGTDIYIFGGRNNTGISNTAEVFHTTNNTIETLSATLSEAKFGMCSEAIGDSIYILGGSLSPNLINLSKKIEVFNVKTKTFVPFTTTLSKEKADIAATTIGDSIYILGGIAPNFSKYFNEVEMYNAKTQHLSISKDSLIAPSFLISAATLGDKIFIFGVMTKMDVTNRPTPSNTIQMLDPIALNSINLTPVTLKNDKAGTCAVTVGHKIYVFGGIEFQFYPNTYYKTIEIFEAVE